MASTSGRLAATAYVAAHQVLDDDNSDAEDKEKAAELLAPVPGPRIGDHVLIRTVTLYQAGTIIGINADYITLTDAVSVREAGETASFWRNEAWKSAEAYASGAIVWVARGPIIEIVCVNHKAAQ